LSSFATDDAAFLLRVDRRGAAGFFAVFAGLVEAGCAALVDDRGVGVAAA